MTNDQRTSRHAWRQRRARLIKTARGEADGTCPLCKTPLAWDTHQQPASPEVDHIIPVSRGGTDSADNLRVICRACNQSKGNRTAPRTAQQSQPSDGRRYLIRTELLEPQGRRNYYSDGTSGTTLIDW